MLQYGLSDRLLEEQVSNYKGDIAQKASDQTERSLVSIFASLNESKKSPAFLL